MTDIFKTNGKVLMRSDLFQLGVETLRQDGWRVEREPASGKSSVRRITKNGNSKLVSIRTSQDTWIAFPRNGQNDGWATLEDVEYVIAVSVDDKENPKFAQSHMIAGTELRQRFDRAYKARKDAKHTLPHGRGVWVSLYNKDSNNPVSFVGAGAGLTNPPLLRIPIVKGTMQLWSLTAPSVEEDTAQVVPMRSSEENLPLSIAEAKRRLAFSLGVQETDVRITISS